MLKKKLTVLWTLTDSGIILQNLNTNVFYELTEMQEKIWAYVDGTHSEKEIVNLISEDFNKSNSHEIKKTVAETLKFLLNNELIADN